MTVSKAFTQTSATLSSKKAGILKKNLPRALSVLSSRSAPAAPQVNDRRQTSPAPH